MKCFFHRADLDGRCSAALLVQRYKDLELVGVDYKDGDFSLVPDMVEPGEVVFVVDFSFPMGVMRRLIDKCQLIWIDHHVTAIKEAEKVAVTPRGLRDVDFAGCELVWKFLYGDEKMPLAVSYIGRYDVWKHGGDLSILAFQYGMGLENTNPGDMIWRVLLSEGGDDKVADIVSKGVLLRRYSQIRDAAILKGVGYEGEFDGLRCLFLNSPVKGSGVFESGFDKSRHDAMVSFCFDGKQWVVGMYSVGDVDVGLVCKKHGGGGHKNAAGFVTDVFPFGG